MFKLKFLSLISLILFNQRGSVGEPELDADGKPIVKDPAAVLAKNAELLKQLADQKAENARVKAELDAEKAALKQKEEDELKAKGDYKTLYDRIEEDKKTQLEKDRAKDELIAKGAKLSAIQTELVKLGINPERLQTVLSLANLTGVKWDESLKLVSGADAEAARLKLVLPDVFGARDPEDMGGGELGGGTGKKITKEEYLAMSKQDQRKHYAEYIKQETGMTVTPKKRF